MKITDAVKLLQGGSELSCVRKAKTKVGHIVLEVKISHYVGDMEVTRALYDALKKKCKLTLNIDKSNSFITTYRLAR